MVLPKTYYGYDKDGQKVCTCPAENADYYVNPAQVKKAIENVEDVVNAELKKISRALQAVAPEAGATVIIQGTKMDATINNISESIIELAKTFTEPINPLYDGAVVAHDKIQTQLNEQARSYAYQVEGVVSVSM